ncbi:MAG: aldo/keto reductase [Candidatus Microbacterium colombiense]|nr:MAG: aldo/keto reductase [Microbacterium sp.]
MGQIQLGLGLIGIGRPWPKAETSIPASDQAAALLSTAVALGIRFFDTAPAYGISEQRFGSFLKSCGSEVRDSLTIATKAGEFWSPEHGSTVDHSPEALEGSLQRSLALLGRVDLLQLHKCTAETVKDVRVQSWLASIRGERVGRVGASVSTPHDLRVAVDSGVFDTVQFPANAQNVLLAHEFLDSGSSSVVPILNRPFASGTLSSSSRPFDVFHDLFERAIVLTGTTSKVHLAENVRALNEGVSGVR